MHPLIKWPGGKSGEIDKVEKYIPKFGRYIEPFFGGGALFFHLKPKTASINDISNSLIEYYKLIKKQDKELYNLLLCYNNSFSNLLKLCESKFNDIHNIYSLLSTGKADLATAKRQLSCLIDSMASAINSGFHDKLLLDENMFIEYINKMVIDKMQRTVKNNAKKPFSGEDLMNNLITGFASGYYMYFRDVYNAINLNRIDTPSIQYRAANFYFIREYCYGSMFRYNAKGEFNIPYGGMSYNNKNFKSKIDSMFNKEVETVFKNTDIHCSDFEAFLYDANLNDNDFMFLDPPYDTEFSDYEGKGFTKKDQERLANSLKNTPASFILIIKNTDFIYDLYKDNDAFSILTFDNRYTYNVRSRNDRNVEHLIITNLSI